jgi:aryl-alcohol dehydrogenase-like predicted oxidoreductase
MRRWCSEQGISLLQLALHFCLREPRIHGNPLGSVNIAQLEMNVAAVIDAVAEGSLDEFLAKGL